MPETAEDAFVGLMKEADAAAWRKSNSLPGKISTSIYYTARKAIRTSPRHVASYLASHVPLVSSVVVFAVNKIADKIRKKRIAAGVFAAEGRGEREPVTTADGKALAKAIADRTKKMDENLTKLNDAWLTLKTSSIALDRLAVTPATSAQAWTTAFWNTAYAYGRVDHYTCKLADMIDNNKEQMEILGGFVEKSTEALIEGKGDLQKLFVAAYDSLITDSTPLLSRIPSSSSFT